MKEEKNKKYLDILFVVIVVAMILAIVAVSFAVFTFTKSGNTYNTMTTGTLKLNVTSSSDLTLLSQYPISDNQVDSYSAFTFSVSNVGTESAKFKMYIIDDDDAYTNDNCANNKLPWTALKYQLKKNNTVVESGFLDSDGVIYSSIISSSATDNYSLKIYLPSTVGNEVANKHFHAKVRIKAILDGHTNYDTGE